MRLLLLFLPWVASALAMRINKKAADPCGEMDCKAGRECVVSGGEAECTCVTSCPDHDKPICGTDGISYDNYCLLHQHACVTNKHISVDYHGYCKHDIELAMREFGITPSSVHRTTTAAVPPPEELTVCYSPERDALRDSVITMWIDTKDQQPWASKDMTYRESLSGHFFACDKDRDYKLKAQELIDCFKNVAFSSIRTGQDPVITRTLCIDAMLEDGDNNQDYRLDFHEFTRMMDPLYQPSNRNCSLEGKDFMDGAEVKVACNHCVCATGNWVCAAHNCPDIETTSHSSVQEKKKDIFGYMDTKYDMLDSRDKKKSDDILSNSVDDDYYEDELVGEDPKDNEEFKKEEAKKEYNALNSKDKHLLDHLENNIHAFYDEVNNLNKTGHMFNNLSERNQISSKLNSVSNEAHSDEDKEDDSEEETSSEEKEDKLLDQYEELIQQSKAVHQKLMSLRNQINEIEEERSKDDKRESRELDNNYYTYNHVSATRPQSKHESVQLNTINHSNRRPDKDDKFDDSLIRKYRKYQALKTKLGRSEAAEQLNDDIWQDQWKAKISKHKHTHKHDF